MWSFFQIQQNVLRLSRHCTYTSLFPLSHSPVHIDNTLCKNYLILGFYLIKDVWLSPLPSPLPLSQVPYFGTTAEQVILHHVHGVGRIESPYLESFRIQYNYVSIYLLLV